MQSKHPADKVRQKPIGFWTALALVVGAMLGAGIFSLPASLASFGSISILAWIITGMGAMFLALTFADLNRMVPETGGAFLYAYKAYGDFMGFSIAISYWLAWCLGCAGAVVAIVGFLSPFFPVFNEQNPAYSPLLTLAIKIFATWITVIINICGIKTVGRIQLITNFLKILPLLFVAIFALFQFKTTNITDFFNISGTSNWQALTGSAALTLWAFTGLEAAVVPADSITNHKVIKRATVIGTGIVTLIYIIVTLALMGFKSATELKTSLSPFTETATLLFGPIGAYAIAICAIITIVGSINGGILILAQDAMAAARYKFLPALFGNVNGKFNTPIQGILIAGVLITLMLLLTVNSSLMKQFNFLILFSTLSLLIPYFISSTSALILLMQNPNQLNKRSFILSFSIAVVSSIYAFWTLIGVGQEVIFYGCLFFFSIFWLHLIYKIYKYKNNI